jgi:hypothetical protein
VPALGLVFVFASLLTLPDILSPFAQMIALDGFGMPGGMLAILAAMLGFVVTQLLLGLAVAWQADGRRVLFVVHIACGLAIFVFGWREMSEDLGVRTIAAALGETIGAPLFVVAIPHLFDLRRTQSANAIGGLLIAYGVSTVLTQSLFAFDQARTFVELRAPVGTWAGALLPLVGTLVVAVVAWLAGLRLARNQLPGRMLGAYVALAIAWPLVFEILRVVWVAVDDMATRSARFIVTTAVIALVVAVIRPLVVWRYAKRERESLRVDAALPWVALWFVPHLLVRCLFFEQFEMLFGSLSFVLIALCLALAMVLTLAARDTLRDAAGAGPWLVASALALGILGLAVYATHKETTRYMMNATAQLAPVVLLFATCVTAAWLRRRVTSAS